MVIFLILLLLVISIIILMTVEDIIMSILFITITGFLFSILGYIYRNYVSYLNINKNSKCYKYVKHFDDVGCLDEECFYQIKNHAENLFINRRLENGYYKIFSGVNCSNYHHFIGYLDEEKYGILDTTTRIEIVEIKDQCCVVIRPVENK